MKEDKQGNLIFSASEVGTYLFCPEAWRLREIARAKTAKSESRDRGQHQHDHWASIFDELHYLYWSLRIIALLTLASIAVYIMNKT